MVTDPIADMLTRIRNAIAVGHAVWFREGSDRLVAAWNDGTGRQEVVLEGLGGRSLSEADFIL